MIISNEGRVIIEGSPRTILAEFTCLMAGVKETLQKNVDEETVFEWLARCGQLAVLPHDEIEAKIGDTIMDMLESR